MSTATTPPTGQSSCADITEMLAWHANGTLGAMDRDQVENHLAECQACRTALALEQRIVESIRAPRDNVEQSPHASWQKLVARLDSDATAPHPKQSGNAQAPAAKAAASSAPASNDAPSGAVITNFPAPNPRRKLNWSAALGIAVAVQAAAIAVLAVALVRHRQVEEAPRFHTLSSADPTLAASGPLVRVAFDSAVDEAAAHAVAKAVSSRILAGPSPENVYSFVFQPGADSAQRVDNSVGWLRRQEHVLLVEPVILEPQPPSKL